MKQKMIEGPILKNYSRESWLDPRLEVRSSPVHGKGFFASRPFRAGDIVIVFGGTLFSKLDIEAGKANTRTLMLIDEGLWLGNRVDQPLGEDYFINHSCDPNLWMRDEVTLVARRDIPIQEEVTMDYAMHFADPKLDHEDAMSMRLDPLSRNDNWNRLDAGGSSGALPRTFFSISKQTHSATSILTRMRNLYLPPLSQDLADSLRELDPTEVADHN